VVTATSISLIAAAGLFGLVMVIWGIRGLVKNWNPAAPSMEQGGAEMRVE